MAHDRSVLFALLGLAALAFPACRAEESDGGSEPTVEQSPTPIPLCEPTAGGPHWLMEKETLKLTVSCATGEAADVTLDPLPEGASFDALTGMLTWTPDLAAAAVYHLDLHVAATGEQGRVTIGVADRWEDPLNVPVVDPTKYTEELGLPVFFLTPGPTDDEVYAPATVVYRGHTYAAEAKKRGATSIDYPKNSFTVRFAKEDKFHDEERGFDGVRRLALTQTFDDNSYLRNRLAFTLWNRLDPSHVQIRTYSAVVYLDGEYWGLYTVTDHVDANLMGHNGLGEDGELFKAVSHSANWDDTYQGVVKSDLRMGFVKKEGEPEHGTSGAYDSLEDAVEFVAESGDGEFFDEIDSRFETRDYMHWWVFVRFLHASDSVAKNSFHYLPAGPDAKWRYIPWDFNASFGQSWQTERRDPDVPTTFSHRNEIFARLLADSARNAEIEALYREALDGPWKIEDLLAIVDELVIEVGPAARRDELMWRDEYLRYSAWSDRDDFTDFEGEVEYLRGWIIERWEYEDRGL